MANTARLVIDPITRKLSTKYEKIRLVQKDNKSERITFEMPRYVRGNDMSKCRCIEVHYDNLSLDRKQTNSDIYTVKDLVVAPEDENTINFSWLVSNAATQLVGSVSFSIHFGDAEDAANGFAWHTIPYYGIIVYETKHNNGNIEKTYPDILAKWDDKFADFVALYTERFVDLGNEFDRLKAEGVLIDLVGETGDSELRVMHQKAVTKALADYEKAVALHAAEAEASRAAAAEERAAAEEERANAETARDEAEEARASAESLLATAKEERANAEAARDEAEEARARAEQERIKAEAARDEALAQTSEHIHGWLDDHPEATTTVQDGALTEAKFTDDLKNKTVKEYVTPEMFGYKAWFDDATDYIQQAINTGKPCYLYGHYNIKRPLRMIGDKLKLYIERTLNVQGECGIIVTGHRNVIGGNGEIYMSSNLYGFENASAIKLVLASSCTENEISVKRITQDPTVNTNIGVEITGAETVGNGYFNKITSAIHFFNKGIWAHKTEGQHPDTWNTTTFIDSVINGCAQAVVIDWGDSGGSFLRGSIQPCANGHSILPADFDNSLPVVKISQHWLVDAFIWDMGKEGMPNQSANLYAIEVTGPYCSIFSNLNRGFFKIPFELEALTRINGETVEHKVGAVTRAQYGKQYARFYDNTNDVLLNCMSNPNVTVRWGTTGNESGEDVLYVLDDRSGYKMFFDGTNTQVGVAKDSAWDRFVFSFEFPEPKAIRTIAIWGDKLPKSITIEAATDSDPSTFKEVGILREGVDYLQGANQGQYNAAILTMDYNTICEFNSSLDGRKIKALKIKFEISDKMSITRISAFDVAPHIMPHTGGQFTGDVSFAPEKGVVLQSANGSKFRLSVNDDGTLSATAL
jgi:hypothetical protein